MTPNQNKNIAWWLPRPSKSKYKGSMPLYCEKWIIELAKGIIHKQNAKILNVFCGMNRFGLRVDMNPEVKPDIIGDVHELSSIIQAKYDIILADPPYSNKESKDLYNTPKLNYKKWTGECDKLLNEGGLFIIYHKMAMPSPNRTKYYVVKRVFIGTRTYHSLRICVFYKKKAKRLLL